MIKEEHFKHYAEGLRESAARIINGCRDEITRLKKEVDHDRKLIWLLIEKLGGQAEVDAGNLPIRMHLFSEVSMENPGVTVVRTRGRDNITPVPSARELLNARCEAAAWKARCCELEKELYGDVSD